MRYIIGFCFLFLGVVGFGQVERTAGIAIGTTVPTHTPSAQGALKYYNRSSGVSYRWTGSAWTVETVDLSGYLQWSDTATLATKHYVDSQGFLTAEVDGSITNEIQDLSISGTTLSLSGDASTVDLSGIGLISSGVAGYLPQYTSATALDTTGLFWTSTGRLGIGLNNPTATLNVKGAGTTLNTYTFLLQNSAGVKIQAVLDNGYYYFGGTPNVSPLVFPVSTDKGTVDLAGRNLAFYSYNATSHTNSGAGAFNFHGASFSGTTGEQSVINLTKGFNPSSGTTVYKGINIVPSYNQTSTASGSITGIDYNPTVTSVLGQHYGLLIRSGRSGFGTATPAASAIVDMTSTTQGLLPPRMTTAQRNAISSPATGLMLFCTDCTATDGSTGVSQTYSSGTWKNHY